MSLHLVSLILCVCVGGSYSYPFWADTPIWEAEAESRAGRQRERAARVQAAGHEESDQTDAWSLPQTLPHEQSQSTRVSHGQDQHSGERLLCWGITHSLVIYVVLLCNFKAEQNDACLNIVHYSREFQNVFVSWTPFDLNIYMKYPLKFEFKFVVISVIFTTHALQTCMVFFFLRTVKDTFWRILLTKQIWFLLNSNVFFVHSKEVGGNWNCEYQHSSKCVQQKKEIHTCLKLHEGDSVFSSAHQACIYLI